MKKKNYVWVVTAVSESSDHYGPWVFAKKPSDDELKAFCIRHCPGEFEDGYEDDSGEGPGNWGSYLHITGPNKVEVQ